MKNAEIDEEYIVMPCRKHDALVTALDQAAEAIGAGEHNKALGIVHAALAKVQPARMTAEQWEQFDLRR